MTDRTVPSRAVIRARLKEAKRMHRKATRAAQRNPGDHELRARAMALGATVKMIERMLDE